LAETSGANPAEAPVWYGKLSDGRQFGPVTKTQLDRAATGGQLTADCLIWRQGQATPVPARKLYPHLATHGGSSGPPAGSKLAAKVAQDARHLAASPVDYLLRGPKRPAYRAVQVGPGWKVLHALAILFAGAAGVALVGLRFLLTLTRVEGDVGSTLALSLLLLGGLFCLAGALFQWRVFFESKKAKGMRDLLGDRGSRYFYIGIGWLFVAIPCFVSAAAILPEVWRRGSALASGEGWDSRQMPPSDAGRTAGVSPPVNLSPPLATAGTPRQTPPSHEPRTWRIHHGGQVTEFQGTLRDISGGGAIISTEHSTVGGPFLYFSVEDRAYLRTILESRGAAIPHALSEAMDPSVVSAAPAAQAGIRRPGSSDSPSELRSPAGGPRLGAVTGNANPRVTAPPPATADVDLGLPPIDPAVPLERPRLIDRPLRVGPDGKAVFAGTDPPLVFVLPRFATEPELRVYELYQGRQQGGVELASMRELLAGAPDGSRVAVSPDLGSTKRLTVWRLGTQPAVECEWEPYDGGRIEFAEFVKPEQLITCSDQGLVRLWSLPAASRTWEIQTKRLLGTTPGKRFVVDGTGEALQFIEVATGRQVGSLRLGRGEYSGVFSMAIRRDGKMLVATLTKKGFIDEVLGCWDLTSGQRMFQVPVAPDAGASAPLGHLKWLGSDYLLCARHLVSLPAKGFVWRYSNFRSVPTSPDDRLWLNASYGNDMVLVPLALPDPQTVARIAATDSRSRVFLGKGDEVTLDVQFRAAPPQEADRARCLAVLEQKVRVAGFEIADGQQRILQAVVEEEDLGGTLPFALFDQRKTQSGRTIETPTEKVVQIPNRLLRCGIDVKDQAGRSYWRREFKCSVQNVQVEVGFLQKATAELILNKRWELLTQTLDRAFELCPEVWVYDGLGQSELPLALDDKWLADQAAAMNAERRVEAERRGPKIDLPARPEKVPWNVSFETSAALTRIRLGRPLPIAKGEVKEVKFTSPAVGHVAIRILEEEADGKPSLHRYDLQRKARVARTPMSADASLLDLRPDGQVFLVARDRRSTVLDVWHCREGKDERLVELDLSRAGPVQQAFFVGQKHLLTFDGVEIALKQLPAGDPVYKRALTVGGCWLTHDRNYLIDWDQGRLALFRTIDGVCAGRLAPLPVGGVPTRTSLSVPGFDIESAAFHPEGKRLAVLVRAGNPGSRNTLAIWDLQDGALVKWFPLQRSSGPLRWCGTRYLLLGDELLDVELEAAVWRYAQLLADSPDGQGWYVAADDKDVQHLAVTEVPSEQVKAVLKGIAKRLPPLLQPNETISLDVQVSQDDPRQAEMTRRLTEFFRKNLTDNGLGVRPDQKKTLRVSFSETAYGRNPYRLKDGDVDITVPNKGLNVTVSLLEGGRRTLWEKQYTVELPTTDYSVNPAHADAAADLLQQQEDALFRELERLRVPPLAFPVAAFFSLGQSSLDVSGERVQVDSRFR